MLKGIKTILFTTDLSPDARHAFIHAALLATEFKAKIVLLHVLEELPESVEGRLIGIFGSAKWNETLRQQSQDTHRILMGKVTDSEMVKTALNDFCSGAGITEKECGYVEREIVVKKGDVVKSILELVETKSCDVIVMGACKGLLSGRSIGHNIKGVMKKSPVPVLLVPPVGQE